MGMRQTDIRALLYPGGVWGGYSRFFSPQMPAPDGRRLTRLLRDGLRRNDERQLTEALNILRQPMAYQQQAGLRLARTGVVCQPTDIGRCAASLLEAMITNLQLAKARRTRHERR